MQTKLTGRVWVGAVPGVWLGLDAVASGATLARGEGHKGLLQADGTLWSLGWNRAAAGRLTATPLLGPVGAVAADRWRGFRSNTARSFREQRGPEIVTQLVEREAPTMRGPAAPALVSNGRGARTGWCRPAEPLSGGCR